MSEQEWLDPDIKAMDISFEEKSGLQVYRNYYRACQRHLIAKFRTEIESESFDLLPLKAVVQQIVSDDIRFIPVLVCAYSDEALESMFRRTLPDNIPGGKSNMLSGYGPLSDLSKRIRLAIAFEVISADIMHDLDRVRYIRNKISHSWNSVDIAEFHLWEKSQEIYAIEKHFSGNPHYTGPDQKIDQVSSFRIRLIWMVGRITYEAAFHGRAKKEKIDPTEALYKDGGTKWLEEISTICKQATRALTQADKLNFKKN